jgi:hypothetical protein
MKKYNITKFVKTIIKQYDAHFTKFAAACARQETGRKEKGVTKDRKGTLITQNYKNVHNGHGHGVSCEKPHE